MNIQLVGEEHQITELDREIVDEHFRDKLSPLLRDFDDDLITTRLKIGKKEPFGYITSATLTLPPKRLIHAEAEHEQVLSAITELARKVKKQLHTKSSDDQRNTIRKMR